MEQASFTKAARNICLFSLAESSVWYDWVGQSYTDSHGVLHSFPTQPQTSEKIEAILAQALRPGVEPTPVHVLAIQRLLFVDGYFEDLLSPKDVVPQDRGMIPHFRADLNKYRPLLVTRVLRQMVDEDMAEKAGRSIKIAYRFPEDASKVVDDLYLFHKFIHGEKANFALYDSLNDISALVAPFQAKYPLSVDDRINGYAAFLETSTPKKLLQLLPEGWSADDAFAIAPNGTRVKRRGGAKFVGQLRDGTQVVHLLTHEAGKALGSPRWCTSYNETFFEKYKDDLILVVEPDGRRWQLHFRSGQFNDAVDKPYKLQDLVSEHPGLKEVLAPYYLKNSPREKFDPVFEGAFTGKAAYNLFKDASEGDKEKMFLRALRWDLEKLVEKLLTGPTPLIDLEKLSFNPLDIVATNGSSKVAPVIAPLCPKELFDKQNDYGWTCIVTAGRWGHAKVLETFLPYCSTSTIGINEKKKDSALMRACAQPSGADTVRSLLPYCSAKNVKAQNSQALQNAISWGSTQIVTQLLPYYTPKELAAIRWKGETVVTLAAKSTYGANYDYSGTLREVLAHCPKELVDVPDANQETPLICAVKAGTLDMVRQVLALCSETSVSAVDKDGNTALMKTIRPAIIEELLPRCSAEVITAQNNNGDDALIKAAGSSQGRDAIKLLLPHFVPEGIKHVNNDGINALSAASRLGIPVENLRELLPHYDKAGLLNEADDVGRTALIIVISNCHGPEVDQKISAILEYPNVDVSKRCTEDARTFLAGCSADEIAEKRGWFDAARKIRNGPAPKHPASVKKARRKLGTHLSAGLKQPVA